MCDLGEVHIMIILQKMTDREQVTIVIKNEGIYGLSNGVFTVDRDILAIRTVSRQIFWHSC